MPACFRVFITFFLAIAFISVSRAADISPNGANFPDGYSYLRIEPTSGLTAFKIGNQTSDGSKTVAIKTSTVSLREQLIPAPTFGGGGYLFVGNDSTVYERVGGTAGAVTSIWPGVTNVKKASKVVFDGNSWVFNSYFWISTSGQLYFNWGDTPGDGTVPLCFSAPTVSTGTMIPVPGMSGVKDIQAHYETQPIGSLTKVKKVLILKNDGTVWQCGGYLDPVAPAYSTAPQQVAGLSGITQIASDRFHDVALKSDGTVWAWGYNQAPNSTYSAFSVKTHLLGNAGNNPSFTPVQVHNLANIASISSQAATDSSNRIWLWGPWYDFGSAMDALSEPWILGTAPTPIAKLIGNTFVVAQDQSLLMIAAGTTSPSLINPSLRRLYDGEGRGYFWLLDTPPNDNRANAQLLTGLSGSLSPVVAGATVEFADTLNLREYMANRGIASATVWFKYTAAITGQLAIDTHGSPHDTQLGLYNAGGTGLTYNDDDGSPNGNSGIYRYVTAGQSFDIQLDAKILQNLPASLHYALIANPTADVAIAVDGTVTPHQGSATDFSISAVNHGPNAATNTNLTFTVSAAAFALQPSNYACVSQGANLVCSCAQEQIAVGATATCRFTLISTTQGGATVSAGYTSSEFTDPVAGNNGQSVVVTVGPPQGSSDAPALTDFAALGFAGGLIGLYARAMRRRQQGDTKKIISDR